MMSLYPRNFEITNSKASNTDDITTNSASYVLVPEMTLTPGPGKYLVMFSAFGRGDTANQTMEYGLHIDTTIIAHTERSQGVASAASTDEERNALHTQDVVDLLAGEAINVRFKTDSGIFHILKRSLVLLRLSS